MSSGTSKLISAANLVSMKRSIATWINRPAASIGERGAPLLQELVQVGGHLPGKPPQFDRCRPGIHAVAKRAELLTLQLPETGGIRGDRATELALHRADPIEACDSNLARPVTAGVGVPQRARPVPAVTLRHRPGLQVAARQHGLERLVERIQRNELARLERGAVIEVF